jgi:hypothetical protein
MFSVVNVAQFKLWGMLCVCDVYELGCEDYYGIIYWLVWIKNLG